MRMEQVSEQIWSLKSWMLIPVHVWLVAADGGLTLVDAGFPFMAKGILKAVEDLNRGPLQRILLTHGHGDHVGSIKAILERHPVPVFAHGLELPYMEGDRLYPRRKKLEFSVAKGVARPLEEEEGAQLAMVAGLRPYLTPGHSPGHVAYYHEQDQVLLAGDLFTAKRGNLRRPMAMFTGDMAEAVRSSAIVKQLQPQRLEVCHGDPVFKPADQIDAYLRS
jgi:glyoxylase-like metal-dependent hydrolase (beta-lactamase superfamily II)